ncbi:MAG: hypothetical protein PHH25_04240 [Bacteroidales bacterium]|mgnify:FL=1|nr:hypothetical protein [Bacteroidales bacterium]
MLNFIIMDTSLSLTRIKHLLNRYFIENWKKDLYVGLVLLVIAFASNPMAGFSSFVYIVMILLYTGRIFGNLAHKESAQHYLMIPASTSEKLITNIFLSHIYYVLLLLVFLVLGILLRALILAPYCDESLCYTFLKFKLISFNFASYLSFLSFQSILVFGSIYFKKNAFIKTLLSIAAFFFFLTMLVIFIVRMYEGNMTLLVEEFEYYVRNPSASFYISTIISIVATCFFWILSYFRLRETEV